MTFFQLILFFLNYNARYLNLYVFVRKNLYVYALQHCVYLIIGYTNNIAVNLNFLFLFTFISFIIIFMTFFIVFFLWFCFLFCFLNNRFGFYQWIFWWWEAFLCLKWPLNCGCSSGNKKCKYILWSRLSMHFIQNGCELKLSIQKSFKEDETWSSNAEQLKMMFFLADWVRVLPLRIWLVDICNSFPLQIKYPQ